MCEDVIQIGPWPLCAGWLVAFLPLLGVVIGAVMGFGASVLQDNRRRAWELQGKRREEQREALQMALEWTDPLRKAHIQASRTSSTYIKGGRKESEFARMYPQEIVWDKADFDLPTHLKLHLPEDMYDRAFEIVTEFEQLYDLALEQKGKGQDAQQVINEHANGLREHIQALRDDFRAAYQETFE